MRNMQKAKEALEQLHDKSKFEKLIQTAAIITELLLPHDIRPIIVGGLSVEIYTLNGYTTQDIDFVLNGYDLASEVFASLGFVKLGKNWVHADLGVSVEIPSNFLAGDYDKITELSIADRTVYIIGLEDIILDRLRAAVHWKSGESREWGYRMLLMYFEELDLEYIQGRFEHSLEENEFNLWINEAIQEKALIADKEKDTDH
ncbi:hypothetical protein SAMN04488542_13621 [Fontibacillus panacisegetis]|uniref:UbiD family decarboxylase n=2 Tax=Fontibacillus panacisegetis TaxID=670482 RepID=A0A1G7TEZ3_9BACL|nr:hypothetical protein SAMN04488542_13621 [Fontibacillus panacisegetis]